MSILVYKALGNADMSYGVFFIAASVLCVRVLPGGCREWVWRKCRCSTSPFMLPLSILLSTCSMAAVTITVEVLAVLYYWRTLRRGVYAAVPSADRGSWGGGLDQLGEKRGIDGCREYRATAHHSQPAAPLCSAEMKSLRRSSSRDDVHSDDSQSGDEVHVF